MKSKLPNPHIEHVDFTNVMPEKQKPVSAPVSAPIQAPTPVYVVMIEEMAKTGIPPAVEAAYVQPQEKRMIRTIAIGFMAVVQTIQLLKK